MKKILFLAIAGLISACSSSKYAAHFQYYKSNTGPESGRNEMKSGGPVITPIQPENLVASASKETMLATEKAPLTTVALEEQVRKAYFQMNKVERKNLRKALKSVIRNNAAIRPTNSSANAGRQWYQGWDQDLKLAAVFGAIGTVALIIYVEPFFIIGAVALIIGLVFLIKWFVRQ